MTVQTRARGSVAVSTPTRQTVADCDIHPAPKSLKDDIYPHMEKRWRDHMEEYGSPLRCCFRNGTTYPKGQPYASRRDSFPPGGGTPGDDLGFMREQHLDPNNVAFGILIPLRVGQSVQNPDLSAALCSAMNDWQVQEWTSKDPRLKASVLVPYHDPLASVAEIEKRAGDPNFAQVSLLSRTPEPLGNRIYWPIYAAAAEAGLPVGIHAFGYGGWPVTGSGWPSYYMEDMSAHAQSCQSVVASMVLEGVFERFPKLKLVMVEGGVGWLPSLCWRLDRVWKTMRSELPHLKRPPSEYIREHVWMTSQPIEEPANRDHMLEVLDWIGWDRVLFASDYPHWDFDDPAHVLPPTVQKARRQQFFLENALSLYGVKNG